MNIEEKINELYSNLSQLDNEHLKSEIYFSLIQLKNKESDYSNIGNTIYQDAKLFVKSHILSLESRDLGYDIVNIEKLKKAISLINNEIDKFRLSEFTYRLLKINRFKEESEILKKYSNSIKTKLLIREPYKFGKYFKVLLHLSTYNFWTIISALIFIFAISFVVLLPAPIKDMAVFKITYDMYSDTFLVNHFVNLLANFFGVENNFKIETNSIAGISFLIIMKLFYAVIIVNYSYKKVLEILKTK